ncbi:hypothetical protein HDU98_008239 [Podochytrium sp. JEL0797]|nr:hypothetical protein HDU98_008239 [Podochytrium sp. JEL0797]
MDIRPQTQLQELDHYTRSLLRSLPLATLEFVTSLFPIAGWIHRYNLKWLWGDLIAGVTVGLVVVPQSIAYSTKLAGLPAEFGLYTSFVGVLVYSVFATSKDTTIGPTALLSLVVGQAIVTSFPNASTEEAVIFAATLSFFVGIVEFLLGFLRLGVVCDFVPIPVIAGFTSGAGLQIIISQLPALFGIKGLNRHKPPYLVLIDFLCAIPKGIGRYDTLFGLSSLLVILALKFGCRHAIKFAPSFKHVAFLRNSIVIVLFTFASFAIRNVPGANLTIVGHVPFGFSRIVQPDLTSDKYTSHVLKAIPGCILVSILEHVAVAKAYGRLNGYTADTNQEIVAIGMSNLVGAFVGAFPVTGSFSRSAIQSSSGAKTPMAPFFTGVLVVVGLFSLTKAMHFIPSAVLAAVVVTAISELISGVEDVKAFFEVELQDFIGFQIALWTTLFSSIETSIYVSVCYSLFVLLLRIARPEIKILSRNAYGSWIDESEADEFYGGGVEDPSPKGVLVFRPEESLTYPNSTYLLTRFKRIVGEKFEWCCEGGAGESGERVWNDDGEERKERRRRLGMESLPSLRAVVFDMSAVNHIDYTGLQTLLDCKQDLERFSGQRVPFHFAYVRKRNVRTLWRVNKLRASGVDATPGVNTRAAMRLVTETSPLLEGVVVGSEYGAVGVGGGEREVTGNGRYFHLSIDDAVRAAVRESGREPEMVVVVDV